MKTFAKQQILDELLQNGDRLRELGVQRIGLFGSYLLGTQTENSDVDLLVEFQKGKKTYKNFIGTADFAESIIGKKVDMVTPQSLSPYIFSDIEKDIEYVQIT